MGERNYLNLIGETLGTLTINTILRYEAREPVWGATCGSCGSSGVAIPHRLYRQGGGNIKCTSSICGKPQIKPSSSSTGEVRSRGNGWDEYYAEKLSAPAPPEPPKVDIAAQQREKRWAAEQQRRSELYRKGYRQYFNHATTHGWNLEKLWSLADFSQLSEATMNEFLEKQKSGRYDPSPGGK